MDEEEEVDEDIHPSGRRRITFIADEGEVAKRGREEDDDDDLPFRHLLTFPYLQT